MPWWPVPANVSRRYTYVYPCHGSAMAEGSHHKRIEIDGVDVGYVRIRNDGTVLSVWISTENQKMLFVPEYKELVE